jgi:hypothetical protein
MNRTDERHWQHGSILLPRFDRRETVPRREPVQVPQHVPEPAPAPSRPAPAPEPRPDRSPQPQTKPEPAPA